MKKLTKILIAFSFMLLAGNVVFAQSPITPAIDAQATLVTALSISSTTDMNFGAMSAMPASSTVVLPATAGNPTRSVTGGAVLAGGSPLAGQMIISGEAGKTITINLPTGSVTLTDAGSAHMIANTWTTDATGSANPYTAVIDATGKATFYIGATLTNNTGLPAENPAVYQTSGAPIIVTVDYQ